VVRTAPEVHHAMTAARAKPPVTGPDEFSAPTGSTAALSCSRDSRDDRVGKGPVRDQRAIVRRKTELSAPAARVWQAMLQPSTMLYVLKGLFSFPALKGRIDPITERETGSGWTLLFHAIPFAKWTILVVRVDPDTRTIVTNEHGGIIGCWNHTLHVEDLDATHSCYTDSIEVGAGALTGVIATAVGLIFSYRQRRLRRLVRRHLAPS
jgi:hypothetical protein